MLMCDHETVKEGDRVAQLVLERVCSLQHGILGIADFGIDIYPGDTSCGRARGKCARRWRLWEYRLDPRAGVWFDLDSKNLLHESLNPSLMSYFSKLFMSYFPKLPSTIYTESSTSSASAW